MLTLKKVTKELKNRYYINDKIVIVENVNNSWGYRIIDNNGRLVKAYHNTLFSEDMAIDSAFRFLKS